MRLAWYFAILLWEFALVPAKIITVPHDSPSITYMPSVCDLDCTRVCYQQWWKMCLANGVWSHRTKGNTTSASFTFQGSSVTWYTVTGLYGAKALLYIDGQNRQSVDTRSPAPLEGAVGWTYSGLDPTKQHVLSINYDYTAFRDGWPEYWLDIHHFEYDDGTNGAVSVNGATTAAPPPPATTSTTVTPAANTRTTKDGTSTLATTTSTTTTGVSSSHSTQTQTGTTSSGTGTSTDTKNTPFILVTGGGHSSGSLTGGAKDSSETNVSAQSGPEPNSNNNNSQQAPFKSTIGLILGTTLGSGALILGTVLFLLHRRQKRKQLRAMREPDPFQQPGPGNASGLAYAQLRTPEGRAPPRYRTNEVAENVFSDSTGVVSRRLRNKALEAGMRPSGIARHSSSAPVAETSNARLTIPNLSRPRQQSVVASESSETQITEAMETDDGERDDALRLSLNPPMTPPPRYAPPFSLPGALQPS